MLGSGDPDIPGQAEGASAPFPFPNGYPCRHDGPVLVCGNAWTLHDDLDRALKLYPLYPRIIAVNFATREVQADFIYSYHFAKLPRWIADQEQRFPDADFTVHSSGARLEGRQRRREEYAPWVDYWWQEAKGSGTSVWNAVKMAKVMGFSEIVLCGAPLEPGPYANGKMARDYQRPEILARYRDGIAKDTDWHGGVYSMSGWTMGLLGLPPAADPDTSG